MTNKTIGVGGMSCDHCVQTIQRALTELAGVQAVSVNLGDKKVAVKFDENQVGVEEISSKITATGFEVLNQ